MAVRDIFKVSRKTFFNPSQWIDYEGLQAQNRALWLTIKNLFRLEKSERVETFEEAVQRLNLTEEDIQKAYRDYRIYSIFFFALGITLFVFAFYLLLVHSSFHAWVLALCASAFSLTVAFRYDFWAFQIKHRKLGCTFAEWRQRKII